MFCSTVDFTILVQISVDEVEEEFSRVGLCRNGIADLPKVCARFRDGTEVAGPSPGQETEFVKLLEGCRRRLMDRRDDDELS